MCHLLALPRSKSRRMAALELVVDTQRTAMCANDGFDGFGATVRRPIIQGSDAECLGMRGRKATRCRGKTQSEAS